MRPIPGDIYEFTVETRTAAGKVYNVGDRLELFEETGQAPFGYLSRISNWYVKCKYFMPPQPESVWSSIWNMIEFDLIRRVDD